jgi:hypothetical protein
LYRYDLKNACPPFRFLSRNNIFEFSLGDINDSATAKKLFRIIVGGVS